MSQSVIVDISTKIAKRVIKEINNKGETKISRMSAIIAIELEPVIELLHSTEKEHTKVCPTLKDEDEECLCGASKWNDRIDAVLHGENRHC
jgi:pantothenate kinase